MVIANSVVTPRWVSAISYPTRARRIIVKYFIGLSSQIQPRPQYLALKGQMKQNLDIFSFESNLFIKYKINIFRSFKRTRRSSAEILEC